MAEGRGMTKSNPKPISHPDRQWEVRDAMHTMMRAAEVVSDKPLLAAVKKEAKGYAREMEQKLGQARSLAARGMISDKQMAKMGNRR